MPLLRTAVVLAALSAVAWLSWTEHQRATQAAAPAARSGGDDDLSYEESFSASEGLSDEPFYMPSTKSSIGIGGGAGGAFRSRGAHAKAREAAREAEAAAKAEHSDGETPE